jgi:hypothetical protein
MCLPEPRPLRAEVLHPETISSAAVERGEVWRGVDIGCNADAGADATTVLYQLANPRRHVSLRVLLRLTAMDVCCGPPENLLSLIA